MVFLVQASEGWAPIPWMAMMLCWVSGGRKEEKDERIKDFTQSKLHSHPHLFHPREL